MGKRERGGERADKREREIERGKEGEGASDWLVGWFLNILVNN